MTQIAGLLAIATVFIGLWTLFTVRELMREGGWGRIHGILRYMHICMYVCGVIISVRRELNFERVMIN